LRIRLDWRAVTRKQARAAQQDLGRRDRRQERTDAELLSTQERLELAQAVALIGTWDIDLATGQTVWSQSMGQMLGVADAPPSNYLFRSAIHALSRVAV